MKTGKLVIDLATMMALLAGCASKPAAQTKSARELVIEQAAQKKSNEQVTISNVIICNVIRSRPTVRPYLTLCYRPSTIYQNYPFWLETGKRHGKILILRTDNKGVYYDTIFRFLWRHRFYDRIIL